MSRTRTNSDLASTQRAIAAMTSAQRINAPASTTTDPHIFSDAASVGAHWRRGTGQVCAMALWRFWRGVSNMLASEGAPKQSDIADACGRHPGWVSRGVKAARAFDTAPIGEDAADKFMLLLDGKAAPKKDKESASAADRIKIAQSWLRSAHKAGATLDDIAQAVQVVLDEIAPSCSLAA